MLDQPVIILVIFDYKNLEMRTIHFRIPLWLVGS